LLIVEEKKTEECKQKRLAKEYITNGIKELLKLLTQDV